MIYLDTRFHSLGNVCLLECVLIMSVLFQIGLCGQLCCQGLSVMTAISGPGPSEGDLEIGPQTRLAQSVGLILTRELPESLPWLAPLQTPCGINLSLLLAGDLWGICLCPHLNHLYLLCRLNYKASCLDWTLKNTNRSRGNSNHNNKNNKMFYSNLFNGIAHI